MILHSRNAIGSPKRYSLLTTIAGTLILAALGVAGNHFKITLFFNVDLIFGSIASLLALTIFGFWPGVLTALAASSYTYILWNHPYAIIIMTAEVLFVGLLLRKPNRNIVVLDTFYWMVLGIPLVFIFYYLVMGLDINSSLLIMFKQSINGIINALAVNIILTAACFIQWETGKSKSNNKKNPTRAVDQLMFNLTVSLLVIPTLFIIVSASRGELGNIESELKLKLGIAQEATRKAADLWIEEHKLVLSFAKDEITDAGNDLNRTMKNLHESHPTINGLVLTDADGAVVYQSLNDTVQEETVHERLQKIIQDKEAQNNDDIIIQYSRIPRSCISMTAKIHQNRYELVHLLTCPDNLSRILSDVVSGWNLNATLFSRTNKIVAASYASGDPPSYSRFDPAEASAVFEGGVYLWEAPVKDNISVMERWKQSVYFTRTQLSEISDWHLVLNAGTAPYQNALYKSFALNLAMFFVILVIVVVLTGFGSTMLVRSLGKLGRITTGLPEKIRSGNAVEWPKSFVTEVSELVVNFRSMTEAVREQFQSLSSANDQLKKAKDEAEQANRVKSLFLTNMSHDIRTPLGSVIGMSDLLLDTSLNEEQHSYIEIISQSSKTLLQILNDVVDLSRIEAGKMQLEKTHFYLNQVVEDSVSLFRIEAVMKEIALTTETADNVPRYLYGDPYKLRQVLINLVGNAVKFTSHGSVTVTISREDIIDRVIKLRFSVTDTGIGIPPEQQKVIFESFTQGKNTPANKYGGSGLGLTISRHIVSLMEGSINLDSEPGKGSTFSFTAVFGFGKKEAAAVKQNEPGITEQLSPRDWQRIREMNVLVVDDNKINQILIQKMLDKHNISVTTAESGEEAITLLGQEQFDFVLMDIQMPGMNGFETTGKIRKDIPHGREIPIIAMTAYAGEAEKSRCLKAGMNEIIIKPFAFEKIIEKMARQTEKNG
jgi:signal transduction histidine kinase/ActR/RegA family two-component response regulator